MYRIISGKWKAKRILAPKNFEVRPTTDFAKEALFSILEHRLELPYISALDLFAGIGSISLELASRDCQDITSVEFNPKHAAFIQSTAQELDFGLQINVQRSDVFEWLKKSRNHTKSFNLIFADPPFDLPEKKYYDLINLVLDSPILAENGLFVLEHQSRMVLEHQHLKETRKYGNVSFSFFEKETV
ncbi:RsmD family RNA methyltransferase [Riemerella anatipestifer]|uniref:RsmD family RNA methyltransferase n=1 Tax=Riemerella anatipestifer TaxID=34085 RepID=UPI0012AD5207|nr:RsmD family RNA methyltransferase [Riemerella anatipestifer]MDY3316575.1 RsmD family RNA methyltransferase [Riemerella anatipestifer]USL95771.1 RsmD family RNA methyltransferase [Riemerella anatipestifer]